jgi:hypothetical protein
MPPKKKKNVASPDQARRKSDLFIEPASDFEYIHISALYFAYPR